MKIAQLQAPRKFTVIDQPLPEIAEDEVLVRVAYCGICTSELDVWEGATANSSFPMFPGHEVSGIVERVGEQVRLFKPGDPVAVLAGRGFAEYAIVKAERCFHAGAVPLDLALGEPLACAVNAVELANIALGDDVVIIGAGFMGALVQQLVNLQGPRYVIVADLRADVLEHAKAQGATHIVNVNTQSLQQVVQEVTDRRGADVSFEVTGRQTALLELGDITRMSGKLVIVGYHQDTNGRRAIPLAQWNYKAFQIVNAHFREHAIILHGMRTGMRLLTASRLNLDSLVTHRFPLHDINSAFEAAHTKPEGFLKATVAVGGRTMHQP